VERRRFLRDALLIGSGVAAGPLVARTFFDPAEAAGGVYRAFRDSSEWNRPLPANAPIDDRSGDFIRQLSGWAGDEPFAHLGTGSWAEPIYWAGAGDPEYWIERLGRRIRIPKRADAAATADAQLTVFDRPRGYVAKLQGARRTTSGWSAANAAIYFLGSNGLHADLKESDDGRNRGHRGFPPAIHAVRLDELRAGKIAHVLKVAIPDTASRHVYPAIGNEGGDGIIPEGAMFRIKRSVDLRRRGLRHHALTIARAMQVYGVVIGDRSGTPMTLKMENLVTSGRQVDWDDLGLDSKSLSKIRFGDMECIRLGYHRPKR
jgi:hypothetical protein